MRLHFPNIFIGQFIHLSSNIPDDEHHNLKRHIEAYGGKVLTTKEMNNEEQLSRITHCIGTKDEIFDQIDQAKEKLQSKVTHISLPTVYVWKCIANKCKL